MSSIPSTINRLSLSTAAEKTTTTMAKLLLQVALLGCIAAMGVVAEIEYTNQYSGGYGALLKFNLPSAVDKISGTLTFDIAPDDFQLYSGSIVGGNGETIFEVEGNGPAPAGPASLDFGVRYSQSMPQVQIAVMNGIDVETNYVAPPPPTERPTKPPGPPGSYHYDEVLGMSLEFYEAQRSGKIPPTNRIVWRGDAFMDDGQMEGIDLTGGYFDAGDHVKFGFPFAYFTTVINWGLLEFGEGYALAGETSHAHEAVRWSLDYFIKAHPAPHEFYGQTGDGSADHAVWGRPEDWAGGPRPSFKITEGSPGSDLAGEASAAFTSGYLVFKDSDAAYAATLLSHARDLYDFANQFRAEYTGAIPASGFYDSWSGFGDELAWSAAWLYRATGEQKYLDDVKAHYDEFGLDKRPEQFSWDDKTAGVQVLLAQTTNDTQYVNEATAFCDWVLNDATRTPLGLVHLDMWGSLRHAANAAFICLNLADLGVNTATYRSFAKQQIGYMLGDTGRSYVVGYGVNPPQKPHHRGASCPNRPSPCDYGNGMGNPGPNYQTLYGALVGGPGTDDSYVDDRNDFIHNEVATDYNAAFQGVLAALHLLKENGQLP